MRPIARDRASGPPSLYRNVLGLCLVVLCFVSLTAGATEGDIAGATRLAAQPVTIEAIWEFDGQTGLTEGDLIGLLSDSSPTVPWMSVAWKDDRSGWFPTWRLQLRVWDAHRAEEMTYDLLEGKPQPGRYTIALSLHPSQNIVSVAVYDADDPHATALARQAIRTKLHEGRWYLVESGLVERRVSDGYGPVATTFDVGEATSGGSLVPMTSYQAMGTAHVRVSPGIAPPGEYRLSVYDAVDMAQRDQVDQSEAVMHFDLPEPKDVNWIVLPLDRLPLGPVTLVLEYVEDGRVLFSQGKMIRVGQGLLQVDDIIVDRDLGQIQGKVTALAETALPGVELTVEARFYQLVWDEISQTYSQVPGEGDVVYQGPFDVLRDESSMFSLPLPELEGAWKLVLNADSFPRVSLSLTGNEEYFFNHPTAADTWVAVTDQASRRIIVLDPNAPDWNHPDAVKWSWSPLDHQAFAQHVWGWALPSGVKLRKSELWGGEWVVAVDSRGFAAIVPYPAGDVRKWSQVIEGNLHSAELLPDGNIAIAASTGGWVRIYTSSQGPDSALFTEYPLPGAHGVLWDPELELLWAVGDYTLVALEVIGTPDKPGLRRVRESSLPTPWGHDLSPVYGDSDRLWITTNTRVYQYVKSTDTWLTGFVGGERLNLRYVKGIGNQPSGRVIFTQQKPDSLYTWTTDTVNLLFPAESRTRHGAAFYKARLWNPAYQ